MQITYELRQPENLVIIEQGRSPIDEYLLDTVRAMYGVADSMSPAPTLDQAKQVIKLKAEAEDYYNAAKAAEEAGHMATLASASEKLIEVANDMQAALSDLGFVVIESGEMNAFLVYDGPPEPDEEDWLVTDEGHPGSHRLYDVGGSGGWRTDTITEEAAIIEAFALMDKEEFWPNLWVNRGDNLFQVVNFKKVD